MILGRFAARTVLFLSAATLTSIVADGGALLGVTEGIGAGCRPWARRRSGRLCGVN